MKQPAAPFEFCRSQRAVAVSRSAADDAGISASPNVLPLSLVDHDSNRTGGQCSADRKKTERSRMSLESNG